MPIDLTWWPDLEWPWTEVFRNDAKSMVIDSSGKSRKNAILESDGKVLKLFQKSSGTGIKTTSWKCQWVSLNSVCMDVGCAQYSAVCSVEKCFRYSPQSPGNLMIFILDYPGKVMEFSFQFPVRTQEKNVRKGGLMRSAQSAAVFRYPQKKNK